MKSIPDVAGAGLKPHLTRNFKLSDDPKFAEKVTDVVGLYMNPPDKALVLCAEAWRLQERRGAGGLEAAINNYLGKNKASQNPSGQRPPISFLRKMNARELFSPP